MKWSITEENVRRTVTFKIEDGEPLQARAWRWSQDYEIKPEQAVVTVFNGERKGITIHGPRLLKDGRASGVKRGRAEWNDTDVAHAPAWVRELWLQVRQG